MLNRHLSSIYSVLQARNVTEDKHNDDGKNHAGKQQPVLRLLVEQGWLLENAQPPCARRKEVKKLHDDQRDKVDATRHVDLLVDVVCVVLRIVLAVLQPHGGEWDALCLEVPECHGKGQETLEQANKKVSVKDQARVDEAVLAWVTGRAQHDICFGFLVREGNCGGTICETANDDLSKLVAGLAGIGQRL